mmetsp:Transcript_12525/g.26497  ORF Transcript_12525/g.26497 Transcript_12525/m.26497 type:complete len:278 (-) Transcript_12525:429-1262(-)
MTKMVHIVDNDADGKLFFTATAKNLIEADTEEIKRVAFDCEGVNLGRMGSVELVSLCFSTLSEPFLVVFGPNLDPDVLGTLKNLFENDTIVKVVHDCRMDADALYHLHGITVKNVHDTSCFHAVITGQEDVNLNQVLSHNGVTENYVRDKSVYSNPAYWATRPLTQKMIDWASSDVDKLLDVAIRQGALLEHPRKHRAIAMSSAYASFAKDMEMMSGLKVTKPMGEFIGRRGANVRRLQKRTGTLIYRVANNSYDNSYVVYFGSQEALSQVKQAMGY